MTGTIINVIAILAGGALGLLFGARLSNSLKNTVISGMGLFTTAIGLQMFLKTENALLVLGALILGVLLGEWWALEDRLQHLGVWLEERFSGSSAGGSSRFVRGFLTASLLYVIGPMAILGAISDGLTGDYNTLAIKSTLDGFASIAFASSLGVGVLFAALPILVYQGGISLLAGALNSLVSAAMMNEMTATGGILLMGVGISTLLELKKIRVGNFLPALALAPLLVYLLEWLSPWLGF
jgi:uncharacterized membrane protein YqgA involved in biofilm formation